MRKEGLACETVVISGPSGVGKDSVVQGFQKREPRARMVVTYTSRPPRTGRPGVPDEVDGVDYWFKTRAEFEQMIEEGFFEEYVMYGGDPEKGIPPEYKGTAKSSLVSDGSVINVWRVDPTRAAAEAEKDRSGWEVVYLGVASLFDLKRRWGTRGEKNYKAMSARLKEDWTVWQKFESIFRSKAHVIVNEEGKLDQTVEAVLDIVSR